MSPTVERLQALLSRIQKKAGLLAQARADGSYYERPSHSAEPAPDASSVSEAPASAQRMQDSLSAEGEILDLDAAAELPPEALSRHLEATSYDSLPPAPGPGKSGELLAMEPDPSMLDDDALEAELRVSEASGAWSQPQPEDEAEPGFADEEDGDSSPRTPPPESGPQVSVSKSSMPPRDSVPTDAIPSGLPKLEPQAPLPEFADEGVLSTSGNQPSIEQLGSTVDLEPATAGPLDIAAMDEPLVARRGEDEFEEDLPRGERGGVYDESLAPPPNAQDELHAYDLAEQERQARRSVMPEVAMSLPHDTIAAPPVHAEGGADGVVARSPVAPTTLGVTYEGSRPESNRTFLQLLDDALSLGAE